MILVPNEYWHWCFDEENERLMLDLSDGLLFNTAYQAKQLSSEASKPQAFTLDDVSCYFHLLECIGELPFSEAERVQIVLNAIAALRFAKPQMVRSHFFRQFDVMGEAPLFGEVVTLVTEYGHADFLVIEPGSNASVAILLGGVLRLDENKELAAGGIIKVMNNRIIPFHAVSSQLLRLA